jgi:hypothetical protein
VSAVRIKQPAEDGRAIGSRRAEPFDGSVQADQRRDLAIADEAVRVHASTIDDFVADVNKR